MGGNQVQCAQFIKELGRGKQGSRSLDRTQAAALWAAVLAGEVSDLELGAVLIALRVKGESIDELDGFLEATHAAGPAIEMRAAEVPVVIPSYNGARQLPNLVPLLAALLAGRGIAVLVHGIVADPMSEARRHGARVTSAEVFRALDLPIAAATDSLARAWQAAVDRRQPLFVPIDVLHPRLARVLALRRTLGVRNSSHTLAKVLQPFARPALRIASYTHPEYRELLDALFTRARADALLMRATEGEAAANVRRIQRIDAYDAGVARTVVDVQAIAPADAAVPADRDAPTTAAWSREVLAGTRPVPNSLVQQIDVIVDAVERIARRERAGVVA